MPLVLSNLNVEVHAFPANGKYCAVNNAYGPQSATVCRGRLQLPAGSGFQRDPLVQIVSTKAKRIRRIFRQILFLRSKGRPRLPEAASVRFPSGHQCPVSSLRLRVPMLPTWRLYSVRVSSVSSDSLSWANRKPYRNLPGWYSTTRIISPTNSIGT